MKPEAFLSLPKYELHRDYFRAEYRNGTPVEVLVRGDMLCLLYPSKVVFTAGDEVVVFDWPEERE